MNQRAEIVASIQKAASFEEQAALVSQLDAFDRDQQARVAASNSVDLTDSIIRETLTPVAVHERSTIETDWLGTVESSHEDYANQISAEAALWFGRTSAEVKADGDEFAEQAKGMARRTAGKYGEQAEAAEAQFLDYVTFLRTQAASGLPQVQQEVDSMENPAPEPLNPEVFDNFQPEIHPLNQGVSGTETSERAPLLQEIEGNGGGAPADADPSHHDETQQFEGPEPVQARPGPQGTTSSYDAPSMALGYVGNLDDFKEMFAKEAVEHEAAEKEAASGLPQVQQVVDSFENPAPKPLPTEVAYPWELEEGETEEERSDKKAAFQRRAAYVAGLMQQPYDSLNEVERTEVRAFTATLTKRADQWTEGAPQSTSTPVTSPGVTPPPTGSFAEGESAGKADWPADGPTYADDASAAPDFVQGYSEGYGEAAQTTPAAPPGRLPPGAGGMQSAAAKHQPLRVSASFTSPMETSDPDFTKGYRYATKWTPRKPLVKRGSVAFEAGLYAGMSDNPEQQEVWVDTHRKTAERYRDATFLRRIKLHREFTKKAVKHLDTLRVQGCYLWPTEPEPGLQATAGTSTDLDTMTPGVSPSPAGDTPINGPGQTPPLQGGTEPNRPGGPAPYNGAEPYGQPAVPNGTAVHGAPTAIDTTPGGPVDQAAFQHINPAHMSPMTQAFRKRVQANLLQSRQGE